MKHRRYIISIYIFLPLIFAGIALLTTLVSYNITIYCLKKGLNPELHMVFWALVLVFFSAITGLLIVRFIIDPMERFIKKTNKLGVLTNAATEHEPMKKDEITRYTKMFARITDFLGRVEARELFPDIVGHSKIIRAVFYQIMKVAPTDSTILIHGETGTGKELFAKSIYAHSLRKEKPFVTINCAAIPEGLLESELFGHEKGAFTGANAKKLGKIEIADGGTIFMDEIGDMPLTIQAKVLRVIQESQFERVGGINTIKVDVRFIAATNKNLSSMVDTGTFREDLFFRLNVFSINLPPLRKRREDIPLLVDIFLKKLGKGKDVSADCLQLLTVYDWPGNIRELENTVESASVLAKDVIDATHLPSSITEHWRNTGGDEDLEFDENRNLNDRIREFERGIIIQALLKAGGVQVTAARLLGISERSFWHRVKKFDIDVDQFK